MTTIKKLSLSKACDHIKSQVTKLHKKHKGPHEFLNALFYSPGDEYYGVFDKSHTYKAVADFQRDLQIKGLNIVFTDVKFDSDLNLIYYFEIEKINGTPIGSVEHKTNFSKPKEPSFIGFEESFE